MASQELQCAQLAACQAEEEQQQARSAAKKAKKQRQKAKRQQAQGLAPPSSEPDSSGPVSLENLSTDAMSAVLLTQDVPGSQASASAPHGSCIPACGLYSETHALEVTEACAALPCTSPDSRADTTSSQLASLCSLSTSAEEVPPEAAPRDSSCCTESSDCGSQDAGMLPLFRCPISRVRFPAAH